MSPALAALDVATHWPYVRSNLHLERRTATDRALHVLAEAQVAAGGAPVGLGRAKIALHGLTHGEAGNVWRALRELEDRRVVVCNPGRGTRAHAWSFHPDLAHWRAMPWALSGRDVERGILACGCRAVFAVAARFPGQSVGHMENSPEFQIFSRVEPRRPGLFLVDSRGYREDRAATANSRAWHPVDSRGYGDGDSACVNSSRELIVLNSEEEQLRMQRLTDAAEARCGQLLRHGSAPWKTMAGLCGRLTDEQVSVLIGELAREPGHLYFPKIANVLEDLAAGRPVKMAARGTGLDYGDDLLEG